MRGESSRWPARQSRARGGRLAVILLLSLLAIGCARDRKEGIPPPGPVGGQWLAVGDPPRRWNALLITLDTTRRDHLGCYGYAHPTSPHLDSLAAAGTLFERAVAPTPVTLPSHATILTGLDPSEHGVRNNGTFLLDSAQVTLAERLRDASYATGAIVGAFPVAAQFGLDQGFDTYDDEFPAASQVREWQTAQRRAAEVTTRALEWIDTLASEPFFCWVHYFDPHFPYDAPRPFRDRFTHSYDAEIAYMDAAIGGLVGGLRQRGLDRTTWLLLVGDHGESLGEHGEPGHSMLIYGATQYVPCLMVPPTLWAEASGYDLRGLRVSATIGLRDLAATLCNALGLPSAEAAGRGVSLLPLALGTGEIPAVAYNETLVPYLEYGWSDLRGVRTDDWCYIRAPEPELYDLTTDPGETINVLADHPEIATRLSDWCDEFIRGEGELDLQPLDAATAERLRSLGYVAGGAVPDEPSTEKDPKALIHLFTRINDARTALAGQQPQEARRILAKVLAEDPGNPEAERLLGHALLRLGQGSEAAELFAQQSERRPRDREARLNLARAHLLSGELGAAEAELATLIDTEPDETTAYELYANVLSRDGRESEAWRMLERARERDPQSVGLQVVAARLAWAAGDMERAVEMARQAHEQDAEHAGALAILGECLWWQSERARETGDAPGAERLQGQARALLTAALEQDPTEPVAAFRLAFLARGDGQMERAIELYQRALARQPERAEAHVNLGNLLREAGRLGEALHYYEIAYALGYGEINFLVNYGVGLAMSGRTGEALVIWERALELAPDQRYADGIRRNIEMLRRGGAAAPRSRRP